ncbi:hypothetical protein K443DRAFT_125646 [Laccaria amethystina LaAM-08-1]|uniref:Uncharacterized protein n=1 Tax=Laccaria amethystina LaAM-08-1 TaxID=1095629 RepID=A0A0C9WWV4_9AGAR|nr:hypothetical protein K443DRAFT_125646 [Laccaria amethystina LaAM-08-1]
MPIQFVFEVACELPSSHRLASMSEVEIATTCLPWLMKSRLVVTQSDNWNDLWETCLIKPADGDERYLSAHLLNSRFTTDPVPSPMVSEDSDTSPLPPSASVAQGATVLNESTHSIGVPDSNIQDSLSTMMDDGSACRPKRPCESNVYFWVEIPPRKLTKNILGGKRRTIVLDSDDEPLIRPSKDHQHNLLTAGPSHADKGKGQADPPSLSLGATSRPPSKTTTDGQKETSVQPKCRGCPPKGTPVVFKHPVVFDKKHFKCVIERFGIDEFLRCSKLFSHICQNHVSSAPCARTKQSKTAHSADGVLLAGHALLSTTSLEEFAAWFNFMQDFAGPQSASTPEGFSRVDLEELASRVAPIESSPVAGPSLLFLPESSPTPPRMLIPPITFHSPDVQPSTDSEEDEDQVLDQLAGDYDE